jgi:hypothetical protein
VIIMALLLLTAGMIFIVQRRPLIGVVAAGGVAQLNERMSWPLLVPAIFAKTLGCTLALVLVGIAFTIWLSGSISATDIGGTILCALIFAYLVHLLILAAKNSQQH